MIVRFGMLLFLFFLFNASTCEREVELDLEPLPDKLFIYCSFEAGEQVFLELGKSRAILNNNPDESLPGAVVNLYQGDVFLEALEFIPGGGLPHYESRNIEIESGKEYMVEATLAGFDKIEAVSEIPEPSSITNYYFSDLSIKEDPVSEMFTYNFTINVQIDDSEEETNYYHLEVWQEVISFTGTTGKYPVIYSTLTNTNDIISYSVVSHLNLYENAVLDQGVLIKGNPLSNYQFEANLYLLQPPFEKLGRTEIILRTVSRDYYQFHSSLAKQQGATNSIFSEPVFIYENVKGGYGIFAGYSTDSAFLKILE